MSSASGHVLGIRDLNRAFLARQWLLRRKDAPALEAIEHLVGLQSQAPNPPYIGLWTRLAGFRHEELSRLIVGREAVRIALMRSTIHLVSARDCLWLRPLVQPVSERAFNGSYAKLLLGLDLAEVVAAGRALVEERPRTFSELGLELQSLWPDRDAHALSQAIRTFVPLVQVPPRGLWGERGQAAHTSAQAWLGRPIDESPDTGELFRRYLAAFGPASVRDAQAWSGLTGLQAAAERLRPEVVTFRDDQGRELFDLPDAPRPEPETLAPVRFLPEFDNALLSHADRSRIIAEEHKPRVFTVNGIIRGTVLIDGFVGATWKLRREHTGVTIEVEPFTELTVAQRNDIAGEADRLLVFVADRVPLGVRFASES
jgi:hypothetical protein